MLTLDVNCKVSYVPLSWTSVNKSCPKEEQGWETSCFWDEGLCQGSTCSRRGDSCFVGTAHRGGNENWNFLVNWNLAIKERVTRMWLLLAGSVAGRRCLQREGSRQLSLLQLRREPDSPSLPPSLASFPIS